MACDTSLDFVQSHFREPGGPIPVVQRLKAEQSRNSNPTLPEEKTCLHDHWAERAWMLRVGDDKFVIDD